MQIRTLLLTCLLAAPAAAQLDAIRPDLDNAIQDKLKLAGRYQRTLEFLIDDDELLPGTMTIEEGQYRLLFRNAFTTGKLSLAIEDDKAAKVSLNDIAEKRSVGDLILALKPGRLVVYVRQRPRWRCVLTVTEKAKK